jgi:hypothetical protein
MIERQTDRKVKVLHTDNGGEFCFVVFNDYCRQEGIVRHHSIAYTPKQKRCGGAHEQDHHFEGPLHVVQR